VSPVVDTYSLQLPSGTDKGVGATQAHGRAAQPAQHTSEQQIGESKGHMAIMLHRLRSVNREVG
jgi:hypothetical protein